MREHIDIDVRCFLLTYVLSNLVNTYLTLKPFEFEEKRYLKTKFLFYPSSCWFASSWMSRWTVPMLRAYFPWYGRSPYQQAQAKKSRSQGFIPFLFLAPFIRYQPRELNIVIFFPIHNSTYWYLPKVFEGFYGTLPFISFVTLSSNVWWTLHI